MLMEKDTPEIKKHHASILRGSLVCPPNCPLRHCHASSPQQIVVVRGPISAGIPVSRQPGEYLLPSPDTDVGKEE